MTDINPAKRVNIDREKMLSRLIRGKIEGHSFLNEVTWRQMGNFMRIDG